MSSNLNSRLHLPSGANLSKLPLILPREAISPLKQRPLGISALSFLNMGLVIGYSLFLLGICLNEVVAMHSPNQMVLRIVWAVLVFAVWSSYNGIVASGLWEGHAIAAEMSLANFAGFSFFSLVYLLSGHPSLGIFALGSLSAAFLICLVIYFLQKRVLRWFEVSQFSIPRLVILSLGFASLIFVFQILDPFSWIV